MPKLVRGNKLSASARKEVLNAFPYRWTSDNPRRLEFYKPCHSCDIRTPAVAKSIVGHTHPTVPLITDEHWLAEHAFWVVNDGSRLAANRQHAEPAYLAND